MREGWRGLSAETVSFAVGDVLFSYASAGAVDSWLRVCHEVNDLIHSIMTARGGIPAGNKRSKLEFAYAFAKASVAVEALVEVMRQCTAGTELDLPGPSIRAAVLSGEVDKDRPGYPGLAMEHALALKDLAYSGQILASLSARELARMNLEGLSDFRDLGVHRITESFPIQRLFQVVCPGIPDSFPSLRSIESPFTNIVPPSTAFVGRESELFEMAMSLRGSRVLTICGPSGVGKSRSAVQLARLLTHEYLDGAFRVDFGELTQPTFILETIVAQLSFVDISSGNLRAALQRQLGKKQILLIFDNCDLLRDAIAQEIEALMADLKSAELIVTSREPLGIRQEVVYTLPPLDANKPEQTQSEALLVERIREAVPGFVATQETEQGLFRICRRLRGMPLAIELVASKFRALPPEEVVSQIELVAEDTLSNRPDDLQRMVDSILEWIYVDLPPVEQLVFRRLSAFSDGWEADALDFLCDGEGFSDSQIHGALEMLVRKGLVERVRLDSAESRDRLSQALWQFSSRKALAAGEETLKRRLHSQWFARLADETAAAIIGKNMAQVVARTDRELCNIRFAIEHSLGSGDYDSAYRLVLGFQRFWYRRGLFTEGRIWLQRLLETAPYEASARRAEALNVLGVFFNGAGDEAKALPYLEHALDLAGKLDAKQLQAMIRSNMSVSYRGLKDSTRAVALLRDVVQAFKDLGEERRYAISLSALGGCLTEIGELQEAMKVTEASLELHRKIGDQWLVVITNFNLAEIALKQGLVEKAEPLFVNALVQYNEQKDLRGVATSLRSMAVVAERLGQPERAVVLLGAASSVRNRMHQELPAIEVANHEVLIGQLSEKLGNPTFFKRWTEGTSLSPEGAVAFATGRDNLKAV